MGNRMTQLYIEIYKTPQNKEYFADLFGVTIKSIENLTKKYRNDIMYDRKLGKYRFEKLLPTHIPIKTFFEVFQNSIANQLVKNDILSIVNMISLYKTERSNMIKTDELSIFSQYIISCHVAIINNCTLKIEYTGNNKLRETKFIKPHHISSNGYTYYLYASYDKKNKKNIGEHRSFAFNSIHTIEGIEYLKDGILSIKGKGNAYGMVNKDKYVLLQLAPGAAAFFKRERQFEREEFEFITENFDESVSIKMYYNNTDEIKHLIQGWMPQIKIEKESDLKNKIYAEIQSHCVSLIGIDTLSNQAKKENI